MIQPFSYHTHTNFSDGNNSLEQMLEYAVRLGLEEIGISDHLIIHRNIKNTLYYECLQNMSYQNFDTAYEACARHAEQIRQKSKGYPLKVYVGYETDFFIYNGWLEEFKSFLKTIDHDYLLSGNHFLSSKDGNDIYNISCIKKAGNSVLTEDINVLIARHFQTMCQAIKSKLFLFLAHMDYIQNINGYDEKRFITEIDAVISALETTHTGCELSTKGLRRIGCFYPSDLILKKLKEKNIPLIISDDAHAVNELCFAFDKAEIKIQTLNIQNRLRL